jgi:hypothetical protein
MRRTDFCYFRDTPDVPDVKTDSFPLLSLEARCILPTITTFVKQILGYKYHTYITMMRTFGKQMAHLIGIHFG